MERKRTRSQSKRSTPLECIDTFAYIDSSAMGTPVTFTHLWSGYYDFAWNSCKKSNIILNQKMSLPDVLQGVIECVVDRYSHIGHGIAHCVNYLMATNNRKVGRQLYYLHQFYNMHTFNDSWKALAVECLVVYTQALNTEVVQFVLHNPDLAPLLPELQKNAELLDATICARNL